MATAADSPPADTLPAAPADTTGRAVVLYDGSCQFCQRSVRILKRLDWLGKLAFQNGRDTARLPPCDEPLLPERLIEEMHVVTPDRKHAHAGFRAFRWMAWRLPLTFPVAPFLYVPGVLWLGNKAYAWVAKHRYQLVKCADGVCQIGQGPGKK